MGAAVDAGGEGGEECPVGAAGAGVAAAAPTGDPHEPQKAAP